MLVSLFLSFLKIGFIGFGGGMAIISLIQEEVLAHGWLTQTEFLDIVAISQVTPGPIGINCATYVGYTTAGLAGATVATTAIVLPSFIIMLTICAIYDRLSERWQDNRIYRIVMRLIRLAVVVLIAYAAYKMVTPSTFVDVISWVIFAITFVLMVLPTALPLMMHRPVKNAVLDYSSNPIVLMIAAGIAGALLYS